MNKILASIPIVFIGLISSWIFVSFGTGVGYHEYVSKWEYRRLHPELMPSPILVKTFDMGHTNSYAIWLWISLIQYIGDNITNNQFLDFSHNILKQITTLHPYFVRPYEIDLLFVPLSSGENTSPREKSKNKIIAYTAIQMGEEGLNTLCDRSKIQQIENSQISEKLWENAALKNPCASGLLPYYLGFVTYQIGDDKTKASQYYKIASMHDDAPTASRILSILALSTEGDYLASALNFSLIGATGYDIEPYTCQTLASLLSRDIAIKRSLDIHWINEIKEKEKNLKNTKDTNNPISQSSNNCYTMTTKSIQGIYLGYIANAASGTTAKNGNDLINLGVLQEIPTLSTQTGFTVRERKGIWEYGPK